MEKIIDLRSDAVTIPTDDMREAMKKAVVGDDDFGEDPTVNQLEEMLANIMCKEKALFVSSGTMANLIAILTHTEEGDKILVGAHSHIYDHEYPGILRFARIEYCPIEEGNSGIEPHDVEKLIKSNSKTRLITLENSHNRSGGTVMPVEQMKRIAVIAKEANIPIHLDGARIFNAATYLGIDVSELAKPVGSLMFCLTKCLSAPYGSVLIGDEVFIDKARKIRWMLGGGMKQGGIMAAAGIVALETMLDRIVEDHKNAMYLAQGLAEIKRLKIFPDDIQTNIMIIDISDLLIEEKEFLQRLDKHRIKAVRFGDKKIRMVTHKDVSFENIEYVIETVKKEIE